MLAGGRLRIPRPAAVFVHVAAVIPETTRSRRNKTKRTRDKANSAYKHFVEAPISGSKSPSSMTDTNDESMPSLQRRVAPMNPPTSSHLCIAGPRILQHSVGCFSLRSHPSTAVTTTHLWRMHGDVATMEITARGALGFDLLGGTRILPDRGGWRTTRETGQDGPWRLAGDGWCTLESTASPALQGRTSEAFWARGRECGLAFSAFRFVSADEVDDGPSSVT